MDLSKGYLLAKILLCVLLSSLGLLELSYGTSGPKFYICDRVLIAVFK